VIVPFWIVILPNGSRLFFYPKPSFFYPKPSFYPKLSFFFSLTKIWETSKAKCLKSQCRKNFTSRYILYIFCIYFVYTHHLIMIWVEPSRALSEPHVAMCGLEIRLPIPLKRAEARLCLSRFITFAVQKNCTGLNPAYQSAEARFCSTRLQKSWNM